MVESLVFGVAALLTLGSAVMVILNRHPVHSALFLVLTFLGLAMFFLQLHAPFLAAVQVIVYAGAIMVLFVFVIMLLGEDKPAAIGRRLARAKAAAFGRSGRSHRGCRFSRVARSSPNGRAAANGAHYRQRRRFVRQRQSAGKHAFYQLLVRL